jgi:hypothetical protein
VAAGEAGVELGGVGVEVGLEAGPGVEEDVFEVDHVRDCTVYVRVNAKEFWPPMGHDLHRLRYAWGASWG